MEDKGTVGTHAHLPGTGEAALLGGLFHEITSSASLIHANLPACDHETPPLNSFPSLARLLQAPVGALPHKPLKRAWKDL